MDIPEAWERWHQERTSFVKRETEGFTKDLKALEQHIKKLQEIAPKDEAGWPVTNALTIITKLQKDYIRFKSLLGNITPPTLTH